LTEKQKEKARLAKEKEKAAKAKKAEKEKERKKKEREQKAQKAIALKTTLSDAEAAERKNLEKIIERNLANFQTAGFQIGGALSAIRHNKLYRSTHKTFALYVSDKFGLSEPHAYSVMSAAATFEALTEGGVVDSKSLPSLTAAEAIHRGVTKLLKESNLKQDAEIDAVTKQLSRNVYQVAVQSAPKDAKTGEPILSPSHIVSTFNVLNDVAKSGVVEVNGKSVPLNLAAASFDEMITTQSAERVNQMKQSLSDRIARAKEQVKESGAASKLEKALTSATGNNREIPVGVEPVITSVCSIHGRCDIESTSDVDIELGCGCVFVHTPEGFKYEKNTKGLQAVSVAGLPETATDTTTDTTKAPAKAKAKGKAKGKTDKAKTA
jgi:hypothetical protein